MCLVMCFFFFFKQKTAYEMRISDWSSDVCSSDLDEVISGFARTAATPPDVASLLSLAHKLLRTSVIHYEFAALAAEKSLQALERAVRLRSEERRVGKECVGTCRSRGSQSH